MKYIDSLPTVPMPGDRVERFAGKLDWLRQVDSQFAVFGAPFHRYALEAPLTSAELSRFEADLGCAVPDQLASFWTQLGRSGAGPDYGISAPANCSLFGARETDLPNPEKWYGQPWAIAAPVDPNIPAAERPALTLLAFSDTGCDNWATVATGGRWDGMITVLGDDHEIGEPAGSFVQYYERWLDASIQSLTRAWNTLQDSDSYAEFRKSSGRDAGHCLASFVDVTPPKDRFGNSLVASIEHWYEELFTAWRASN